MSVCSYDSLKEFATCTSKLSGREPTHSNLHTAMYPCLKFGSGLMLLAKNVEFFFQGEWQQIDSKNIYNHYYGIGFGYWMCIKAAWSWPIVRYSFPDENCFQVEIKESPNSLPSLNF